MENANLFLAAKDLLEACEALYQMLGDNYIGETPDEELDEREQDALNLYYAATKKANA